jgi:uracil-DNA glycosylase
VLPLQVGEQPSRTGDRYHRFPLSGAVAQTLCQMAGIPPEEEGTRYGRWTWALYDKFDCVNAIDRYQPWDARHAALRVAGLIEPLREVVVFLGRRAGQAYIDSQAPADSVLDGVDWCEWVVDPASPTGRREVVVIPHPSSRNRLYNDADVRKRSGKVIKQAMEKAAAMHETRL